MDVPTYNIFSGIFDKNAIWLESLEEAELSLRPFTIQ